MEERQENLLEFDDTFRFKDLPDTSTPHNATNMNIPLDNTSWLKHNLIADNAGAHNAIFRGKDITNYFDDGSLWTRISSGTFEDLFVGDYIVKNGITWRIAGFDTYLNKGDEGSGLVKHHAVIVPDKILISAKMNEDKTSNLGYVGSEMYKTTLDTVFTDYIEPIFSTHVLDYRNQLTNKINATGYNRLGSNSGCSNGFEWATRKLDLMNEVEVYGSIIWSSSGYDTGSTNTQLPLFKLAPEFICNRSWYWLRDVSSESSFACVHYYGYALYNNANSSRGVRPKFYID